MAEPPAPSPRETHLIALWDKLEAALELSTSDRVMDHLEEIARLCEQANRIARVDLTRLR